MSPFRNISSGGIMDMIGKITDPFLKIFTKVKFMKVGQFDFSVLLAFMSISIVQNILSVYSFSGEMSVGLALSIILQSVWRSLGSLVLGLLIILLIIRLVLSYKKTPNSIQYIMMLNQWLEKILNIVHQFVFNGKEISDRTLLYTALGISIATYILMMQLIRIGATALLKLPI
jgi:YggT family protein